ncbi:hypothetical protein [uncultured Gammaproteobacteria bacterium]|uniref:Uncharacterized protein n=1 Tax=Bathymodiolus azoricus thioautotrophic gill symbiont TaxID=235205 RepID=A0ACA8ZUV1_9GAMM|nr:hypothetical protein AZO1586R_2252 [Bathymodiolus azoricus thioautotrophic gill symbiont]CAC9502361.1 hypothetical protein [uncultured Gammaproteobacteria bacterium]CAC9530555.1 hypothetical protein [uncultured Gammaproteobacteria bacterium]CAC9540647.1 hypothetical protein [uncultured Gammaproteobacteria bacterium]VVH60749.1 hypothetical protein BAZOLSSOX_1923 [uncultured Gammaproteobacteria bacterium]
MKAKKHPFCHFLLPHSFFALNALLSGNSKGHIFANAKQVPL